MTILSDVPYLQKIETQADVRAAILGLLRDHITFRRNADKQVIIDNDDLKQGMYAMQLISNTWKAAGRPRRKGTNAKAKTKTKPKGRAR